MPIHEWDYKTTDMQLYEEESTPSKEPTKDITTWVFEEGTFVPTAKIQDGKQYSIVSDYLGTPIQMYDEQGNKTWDCILDTYGKVFSVEKGDEFNCPFRYQGQYADEETGLYYNRFRYYDYNIGSFLSQDPIRLVGGFKLYSYINNPNFELDILGLARKSLSSRLPEGNPKTGYGPTNGELIKINPQTNEIIQIRTYDADGKPIKDIDFGHDHGVGNPHAHDWEYPSKQAPNKVRKEGRALTSDETNKLKADGHLH